MAISTHGDLVLDVVRAADPAAAEAARSRLASAAGHTSEAGFSVEAAPHAGRSGGAAATPEAFAKFEAMVLQTFIQSMLPKDTESVYGEGMAGEMWQSLMAEQLGAAMASRGGIGIADRILRDHYAVEGEKVALQGVANDPAKPERDEQQMLSVALVQEIQRKLANSLSEDRLASSAVTTR